MVKTKKNVSLWRIRPEGKERKKNKKSITWADSALLPALDDEASARVGAYKDCNSIRSSSVMSHVRHMDTDQASRQPCSLELGNGGWPAKRLDDGECEPGLRVGQGGAQLLVAVLDGQDALLLAQ